MRRLDAAGRADARCLPGALAAFTFERIVTSPYPRCVETVEVLAARLDVRVELADELAPGASREYVVQLLDHLSVAAALVCTHRETFEMLFGNEVTCEKCAGWFLGRPRGRWRAQTYVAPPTRSLSVRDDAVLTGS